MAAAVLVPQEMLVRRGGSRSQWKGQAQAAQQPWVCNTNSIQHFAQRHGRTVAFSAAGQHWMLVSVRWMNRHAVALVYVREE